MKYLKKLFWITFSTFIPFVILAKIENTYIPYRLNVVLSDNTFTLYDIKVLVSQTMPLLYIIAFIMQGLIIMPVWNNIFLKRPILKIAFFTSVLIITIALSVGLSYVIWDKSLSIASLLRSSLVLVFVQMSYWVLNFLILYVISRFFLKREELIEQPVVSTASTA